MLHAHLTTQYLNNDELADFTRVCRILNCKPLLIELARGEHQQQAMATAYIDEVTQAHKIARSFNESGYAIQRIKIEASLKEHTRYPKALYYEWHGKLIAEPSPSLLTLCLEHGAHLSRNALQYQPNKRFITLRQTASSTVELNHSLFNQQIQTLVSALQQGGWPIIQHLYEICLYDSNEKLDAGWLSDIEGPIYD
ncbi:hypothetical protein I2494_18460 [Budviciaceae bacterium BWR-B9]|uniref:Uncharacterized protein n=1 Tax=Limnobaculum allomyrinae TaxID=2791986 RepID=A0ABS1IWR2_9GAMM|nr:MULTISPECIES: hypothetical protein [Limnobaculum]MBK5145660.1 hypothetical protein [Limnobaculum allomyrinae]MBV7692605.1 hypothetical protein [Limnobaculum sp. M2-1]